MAGTLKEAVVGTAGIGQGTRRLPRGRHGIPHELIVADQRWRLLEAAVEAIAERGYASLAVSDLTSRAGVSRTTFYELFIDKHDCALEAQAWAVENLRAAIAAAASEADATGAAWPAALAAGVGAALEFAAAHAGQARLLLASVNSPSEPRLAAEGLALHMELCTVLREGPRRRRSPRPDGLGEQAAVGAALAIAGNCLAAGRLEELPRLRSDILRILLAPFVGAAEATPVAGNA